MAERLTGHPGLFARLGDQASKTFLLDPTDLPFAFILRPRPDKPAIDVVKRGDAVAWEAHIAGPFAALLGMLHGTMDGDALFFSRDIIIEGDTEAVLALRNALDDAEIDILGEITASLGPLGPWLEKPLRSLTPVAERLTGHPGLFARLGDQASKTFLLDPTDLPFAFILRPRPDKPAIDVVKRGDAVAWEAHIAGPFAALLGMLHGTMDGDALFFSRDIIIEGDTEAVLALRNALDDAEIDILGEITASLGPLGPWLEKPLRSLTPVAERLTGHPGLLPGWVIRPARPFCSTPPICPSPSFCAPGPTSRPLTW